MNSMICLFTDFGNNDPYVGQMHQRIRKTGPQIPVVDLFHNLPAFNVRAAAYLLPHYCPPDAGIVYCCVVDPGVGGAREPIVIESNGCFYVGPDNGVFEFLFRRFPASSVAKVLWRPPSLSSSFHGRDLFAPITARLALGETFDRVDHLPLRVTDWPDSAAEILYVDRYGNAITGLLASQLSVQHCLEIGQNQIGYARTFGESPVQIPFWYENANGLVEVAVNQGSAARMLGLEIGSPLTVLGDSPTDSPD